MRALKLFYLLTRNKISMLEVKKGKEIFLLQLLSFWDSQFLWFWAIYGNKKSEKLEYHFRMKMY